jgi:hypothetical protein
LKGVTILSSFLAFLLATMITLPILGLILIFITSLKVTRNKKRSLHLSIDITTVLFIFSVHTIAFVIWEQSFTWIILTIILLTAMGFVVLHWKVFEEIQLKRVFKGFWRFNFLLFGLSYFGLTIYGLINRIMEL